MKSEITETISDEQFSVYIGITRILS